MLGEEKVYIHRHDWRVAGLLTGLVILWQGTRLSLPSQSCTWNPPSFQSYAQSLILQGLGKLVPSGWLRLGPTTSRTKQSGPGPQRCILPMLWTTTHRKCASSPATRGGKAPRAQMSLRAFETLRIRSVGGPKMAETCPTLLRVNL